MDYDEIADAEDDDIPGLYVPDTPGLVVLKRMQKEENEKKKLDFESLRAAEASNVEEPPVAKSAQIQGNLYNTRNNSGHVLATFNLKKGQTLTKNHQLATKDISVDKNYEEEFTFMFQKTSDIAKKTLQSMNELKRGVKWDGETNTENQRGFGRIFGDEDSLTGLNVPFEFLSTEQEEDEEEEGKFKRWASSFSSLNLEEMEEFSIFPGQVAGVEGKILSTHDGRVVQVCELKLPKPFPLHIPHNFNFGTSLVFVAAGPFCTTESLGMEPFYDFMKIVKAEEPDACILIGPLVDASHPLLLTDQLDISLEDNFKLLMQVFNETCGEKTTGIVVASSKEAHSDAVYPTPPYFINDLNLTNVMFVRDPCTITSCGVQIGITSQDILAHLSKYEISKIPIENSKLIKDRMSRLSSHLLSQRSFYPLNPPDESVPFDLVRSAEYCKFKNVSPNVLILPSMLNRFMKEVEGTLVLNPERLTKGKNAGSFGKLMIEIPKEKTQDFNVNDFISGEIVRI